MRGCEAEKAHAHRERMGFYSCFMSGRGLDIGFKGEVENAEPVLPTAIGIDKDYPGYNGSTLPFESDSQDYVFASHVLEHIPDYIKSIQEWHRVLKPGGYLIICVPHRDLYEKKARPPSNWCADHKRFYTSSSLLREIEDALAPNSYRIAQFSERDDNYDYTRGSDVPIRYWDERIEIECVIKKIKGESYGR